MNFRGVLKISLFLTTFTLVWIAVFGFEKVLAYSNDSSEPATRTTNLLNGSNEEERTKELERIRQEVERIREETDLIRIGVEIERIRTEIVLLEKEISLGKINAFSKGMTVQTREGEIKKEGEIKEEIEKKLISPLSIEKMVPEEIREKSVEERPIEEKLVKEKPLPLLASILAAVANIFSNRVFFPLILVTILLCYLFEKRREKPTIFSSPAPFLLIGILMTICFIFLPLIYDPWIMKILPVPSLSVQKGNNLVLNGLIQATWFVFISFFLFPVSVMLPLAWYERGKLRKTKRKIPGSPKVSLIFPAYNEEKFIQKTIEQGLKQDYKGELEIIIIDDGSTDRTFEIANNYARQYQSKKIPPTTVKIYRHEKNLGKPAALNTGFQKATGEISIFSDSDSYLDSDLVSRMVVHFDDPEIGMVAGMVIIDNETNLLTKLQQIEYLYNQEIIRFCQATHRGVLICPGAATAVRTEIAREIPSTERTVTEDADFTFEVTRAGWKVGQEPEAISRTDAPENWKELINQRKRWLYGVLQTIWIHKWAIFDKNTKVPNLWVWWAWIGYIICPITTLSVLAIPLFLWLIGPSYLMFLGFYSVIVGAIFVFAHWYGIKQYTHQKKTKLVFLLPIYMVYQYLLNVLLFYLVIAFILRKGVTVRYGGRNIHTV